MTAKDQFAAHVGLDWADKKHDVCVQFKNDDRIFHGACTSFCVNAFSQK